MKREELSLEQKKFRTVGLTMFIVAAGLLVLRIALGVIPFPKSVAGDIIQDVFFSLPMQAGLLLIIPFFIYKFKLKMSFKGIMEFCNVRRTRYFNILLAIPLGICVYFTTMGVSTVWQMLLAALGYVRGTNLVYYPTSGIIWVFLLNIFLSAVLPAVCEEFTNRGAFLTVMRGSFKTSTVIIIGAIAFGLFHQSISQVFYTACFGALMTYLTIKTKSIFPSVIIHFLNNGFSTYFGFAERYGWAGGGMYNMFETQFQSNPVLLVLSYLVVVAVGVGIVILMLHLNKRDKLDKKLELVKDSGFDHTNKRVVLFGAENKALIEDIGMVDEVYGKAYVPDAKFKPTLRDAAFFIGAIVITALTTVFAFTWGFFI